MMLDWFSPALIPRGGGCSFFEASALSSKCQLFSRRELIFRGDSRSGARRGEEIPVGLARASGDGRRSLTTLAAISTAEFAGASGTMEDSEECVQCDALRTVQM
ncbi:hypothetical protein M6B38_245950 [Iris pallida]|uniref:Uncharacterized protein n=1 Tax=Iris pallida TaxID=29817 RepID=A0AAX6DHB3_IRIPA|nr:hypothetical protein M6B38_245950 [Iris pallida]